MSYTTPLEQACNEIMGEKKAQYYEILSNLLLLNSKFIQKDDKRISAKVTRILIDKNIEDKSHLLCCLIESSEIEDVNIAEINQLKKLLDLDPNLINTESIITLIKRFPNPNYTEIMRKVDIKNELKLYRNRDAPPSRRRI
ncbi:MAG: hypothetical protein ACFFDW_05165 [Candidatus Thorarchaeota archaeon]